MTTITKNIFIYTVIAFASVTATAYVAFHQGKTVGTLESEKQYRKDMRILQKSFDSLQKIIDPMVEENQMIRLQLDTFKSRDAFLKSTLVDQARQKNNLLNLYNGVMRRIDNFSSDSIRKYFVENFSDTTKSIVP